MSEMLNTADAAKLLGLSESTLNMWRYKNNKDAPPFVRLGSKIVRYRREDLERWLASRVVECAK